MAEEETESEEKGGGSGTGKIIVLALVGILVVVGSTVGAMFFMLKSMGVFDKGGEAHREAAVEPTAPAIYHTLEPIVVNINDNGRIRFLQAKMDVMARSQEVIDAVSQHMPRIRNELVLLLSSQTVESVSTPEGKEALRKAALKRIQAVLRKEIGEAGVEDVFITSLIVQ